MIAASSKPYKRKPSTWSLSAADLPAWRPRWPRIRLHVAHLDLAGGKLVATQDQNELGAHLVGLLKLGLERTALIVCLGHDASGAKLLRDGKDVLAQLLAGIGDVDARGLLGTQVAAKGLQGQQGALKTDGEADAGLRSHLHSPGH